MDISKLNPILNKESILKTARAGELQHAAQEVLERYSTYALTHVPLGDTTQQLANLRRVVVENKNCAVGTIVGPYGYGKTSTAVHLWNELRGQNILAIPPFEWKNLTELMDAVYHWIRFEFSLGPRAFLPALDSLYTSYQQRDLDELVARLGADEVQKLVDEGRLLLKILPEEIVGFFSRACETCEQAGYRGLTVFTDELQATLAAYLPSRDQFFSDLFAIVKDILGNPGHWAWVISMNDDTEGTISRLRSDLLQRLQRSALYFRVRDMYGQREYPANLWAAFEQRFGFAGSEIILPETLDAIGQIAAREDLGAGPRMVTNIFSLAVKHYNKASTPYTPIQLVDDFMVGQVIFDQRGKFVGAVRKALDNAEVHTSEANQRVVKLLAAYPMGCPEQTLTRFELLNKFQAFPPLARRELILQQAGGYILRALAETVVPPEQVEQRLTKEFVARYVPDRRYAAQASEGFLRQVLLDPAFAAGWKREREVTVRVGDVQYPAVFLRGTFDSAFPDRSVALLVAAVPQSPAPVWQNPVADADIEMRFELNYALAAGEPSRLLISPKSPNVAVFQFNLGTFNPEAINRILPSFLHDYYSTEQLTPSLALALIDYLYKNRGDLPDDQNRVNTMIAPLRQYALAVLVNEKLETNPSQFASTMVGVERLKDLFRQQCRHLYPTYKTLITDKNWIENLQQYIYALESVIAQEGLSIARGRRPWKTTKEEVADAFHIKGRRLTRLESLLDVLSGLIVREEFSGRSSGSEVTLRFQLHPLEEEWLVQLDASREKVRLKGIESPALAADLLIRQAKRSGYTDVEVQEVLRLLQARQFVVLDQHKNMLVRAVDALDDLRDAVAKEIENLDAEIQTLQSLPEFDIGRYPLSKLRATLAEAKERDEIETVKSQVRQHASNLSAFAASRLGNLREKLQQEQNKLHELVRQGIPAWLGREFPDSPLSNLLEKQRRDLVLAYQSTLDEVRRIRDGSVKETQEISGHPSVAVIKTYDALISLSKQSRVLFTRTQSYEDRREDLDAWRRVSELAVDLNAKTQTAQQVYGNREFVAEVEQLWATLRGRFEAQPLSILGMHADAWRCIEAQRKQIVAWLESRREDFERQCQAYRQALTQAGIESELTIPFDQEHPSNSYTALAQSVERSVKAHCNSLALRLNSLQQIIRYGIRVQRLPLSEAETQVRRMLEQIADLQSQLTPERLSNFQDFQDHILAPTMRLASESADLAVQVQQAVQPRSPVGTEVRLMALLATGSSDRPVDLRGLITRLLEQGEEDLDLGALMRDLQSLFQKNQIAIYVGLVQNDRRRI